MKLFRYWVLLLSYIFFFAFVAKAHAIVTIYEKPNFSGKQLVITQDMPTLGDMNKKMQSFKLLPGSQIKFFDQENFKGKSFLVTSSNKDPRRYRNTIQSLQIIKRGKAVVVVEEKSRFDMWSDQFKEKMKEFTKDKPAPPVSKPVVKTPEPKPIQMPAPAPPPITVETKDLFARDEAETPKPNQRDIAVVIYDQDNMKGLSYNITQNVNTLGPFNNKMSSYVVSECYQVEFFDEVNYKGNSWKAPFPLPSHGATEGYLDNKISSIKITKKPKFFGTKCISEEVK